MPNVKINIHVIPGIRLLTSNPKKCMLLMGKILS